MPGHPTQDGRPECRLAVYGTLAPGRSNHHELRGLSGRWVEGTVRGVLFEQGWGAALGYPGLVLDPEGPTVPVHVLDSPDLPRHWGRLDRFEGPGYRRAVTTVRTAGGELPASIYVLAQEPPGRPGPGGADPARSGVSPDRRG